MSQSIWQLQEAKNKFSEVVSAALANGPQIITRHGIETAVVISYTEYRKTRPAQQKLSEFFAASPLAGIEIDLTRDQSLARDDFEL